MFIGRESPECLYANDANSGRIQPCGLTALSSGPRLSFFGTTSGSFWRIAAARGRHQVFFGSGARKIARARLDSPKIGVIRVPAALQV